MTMGLKATVSVRVQCRVIIDNRCELHQSRKFFLKENQKYLQRHVGVGARTQTVKGASTLTIDAITVTHAIITPRPQPFLLHSLLLVLDGDPT